MHGVGQLEHRVSGEKGLALETFEGLKCVAAFSRARTLVAMSRKKRTLTPEEHAAKARKEAERMLQMAEATKVSRTKVTREGFNQAAKSPHK